MLKRMESREEAIMGVEEVRIYEEAHRKNARLMYRALLNDVRHLNVSGRFLEVGAGPGTLAVMIAEQNPDISITAVDISPDMATVADEHIRQNNLQGRIHYSIADAGDKKAMDELGKFDFVYSTFSLHHWGDVEKSIYNLWHVLKDDGVLYIQDLKRVWWLYYLPLRGGFANSIRAAYLPNEIGAVLQKSGINNYKIKTTFPFFMQSIIAWK